MFTTLRLRRHTVHFFYLIRLIALLACNLKGVPAYAGETELSVLRAAIEVQNRYEAKLFADPGVVAVGIGRMEGGMEPELHVYMNQAIPRASAAAIPIYVEGIPVQVFETDEIKAFDSPHQQVFPLPVPMGVSAGNAAGIFAGTLGVRVHRTGQPSVVGYVTNNHIAAASGPDLCPAQLNPKKLPPSGLDQCQPGRLDAPGNACVTPSIGDLVQAVRITMGGQVENRVDAAFVKSTPSLVGRNILDIGSPNKTTQEPTPGLEVQKSGRTTGRTTGAIQTVNATVSVYYGEGCGTAKFVRQLIIAPGSFSAAGDSGSLILTNNAAKKPVGLLFAGSSDFTAANRIGDVLGALHVKID
ncbi:MAG: hypothetical protein ACREYF_22955 [Gammaproteobacteria bacterium]